ncbi:MAG: hypothetical protein ACLFVK_06620 [Dehalococcoidia bacterium]
MENYNLRVKLFCVEKWREGRSWDEIKQSIREGFNVEPPSTRTLQRWVKGLATYPLTEHAKREDKTTKTGEVVGGLIAPILKARECGEEVEYGGWRCLFSILEAVLGHEKFMRFVQEYLAERGHDTDKERGWY